MIRAKINKGSQQIPPTNVFQNKNKDKKYDFKKNGDFW